MIGDPLLLALVLAVALGFRHALEPDHIVAMTTLVATDAEARPRAAARLGLAWGAGHCLTLVLLGVATLLLAARIPAAVERSAGVAVGALIVLLALRVLVRWRRGSFHFHEHAHDGIRHAHLHAHRHGGHAHAHERRTAAGAFALGLVHGVGGSAGATLLVVAAAESKPAATFLLVVLGTGAAAAMAMFSGVLALGLRSRAVRRRFPRVAPLIAMLSFVFGVYYVHGALGA